MVRCRINHSSCTLLRLTHRVQLNARRRKRERWWWMDRSTSMKIFSSLSAHVSIRVQRSSSKKRISFSSHSIYPSILHWFCFSGDDDVGGSGGNSVARVVGINGVQRSSIFSFRSKVLKRVDVLCAFLSSVLFHFFLFLLLLLLSIARSCILRSLPNPNERNTKMVPLFLLRWLAIGRRTTASSLLLAQPCRAAYFSFNREQEQQHIAVFSLPFVLSLSLSLANVCRCRSLFQSNAFFKTNNKSRKEKRRTREREKKRKRRPQNFLLTLFNRLTLANSHYI